MHDLVSSTSFPGSDAGTSECGCGCPDLAEDEQSDESFGDKKADDASSLNFRPGSPLRRTAIQVGDGEGVAVCAAGPESLVREAQNAVARLALGSIIGGSKSNPRIGDIGYHMEVYSL